MFRSGAQSARGRAASAQSRARHVHRPRRGESPRAVTAVPPHSSFRRLCDRIQRVRHRSHPPPMGESLALVIRLAVSPVGVNVHRRDRQRALNVDPDAEKVSTNSRSGRSHALQVAQVYDRLLPHLRRSQSRFATAAKRRFRPSGIRQQRPSAEDAANRSDRPKSDFAPGAKSRNSPRVNGPARRRSFRTGRSSASPRGGSDR